MLCCLGLRERKGAELIACPTCGRLQVDLFELVQQVKRTLDQDVELPMKVAVMGCVVNGPGEAEGADVAVFCGRPPRHHLCAGRESRQRARRRNSRSSASRT